MCNCLFFNQSRVLECGDDGVSIKRGREIVAVIDRQYGLAVNLVQGQLFAAELILVGEVRGRERQGELALALGVPQNDVVFVSSCKDVCAHRCFFTAGPLDAIVGNEFIFTLFVDEQNVLLLGIAQSELLFFGKTL